MKKSVYTRYLPGLRQAPLFADMADEEILTVLDALKPVIAQGRPVSPPAGICHESFRLVVRSESPYEPNRRIMKYQLPDFGEVGAMMGEVLVFSRKEEAIKPTPLSIKPALPKLDFPIECLEFTRSSITRFYGEEVAPAQGRMMLNLMGILAQKAVNARRDLYLEQSGYDIFAEENRVSANEAELHTEAR